MEPTCPLARGLRGLGIGAHLAAVGPAPAQELVRRGVSGAQRRCGGRERVELCRQTPLASCGMDRAMQIDGSRGEGSSRLTLPVEPPSPALALLPRVPSLPLGAGGDRRSVLGTSRGRCGARGGRPGRGRGSVGAGAEGKKGALGTASCWGAKGW